MCCSPQGMTRQLAESRDSLQFSNQSCEQLEGKVEELEQTNAQLKRQLVSQHSSLDQKTQQILSLEDELLDTRSQNTLLRERTTQLMSEKKDSKENTPIEENRARERSKSCLEVSIETHGTLLELTGQIQKLTFQKEKSQRALTSAMNENESLMKSLEIAEQEIEELTHRVAMFEDVVDGQSSTPKPAHSTPSHPTTFVLPSPSGGIADHTPLPPSAPEESYRDSGVSLFNEIDTEYSSLRYNYDTLVQGCTCSASLRHKTWTKGRGVGVVEEGVAPSESRPYKELFAEMFATLKQTAQVADRLMERRKDDNN